MKKGLISPINILSISWEGLNWSLHAGKYSIVWGRNIKLISQNRTSPAPTRKSFSQVRVQHLTLNYHSEIILAGEKVAIFDSDHWTNNQPAVTNYKELSGLTNEVYIIQFSICDICLAPIISVTFVWFVQVYWISRIDFIIHFSFCLVVSGLRL